MNKNNRITSLDALRGIVLFGILLAHSAACFNFPFSDNFCLSPVDLFFRNAVDLLLVKKCRIIFSILFGISFYLILKNPNYTVKKFVWRCFLLFLLGLLMKVFYTYNVLMWYGLMGIILVCFRNMKTSNLLLSFLILFLLSSYISKFSVGTLIFGEPLKSRYLADSSLLDILSYPLFDSSVEFLTAIFNGGIFLFLSYFVLGYYLGKVGFVNNIDKYLSLKNIIVSGGGCTLFYLLINQIFILCGRKDIVAFLLPFKNLFVALFYIIVFLYLYKRFSKYFSWLESYGKLGLTNYCLQDILGVIFMTTIFAKSEYSFTFMLFFFIGVYLLLFLFSIVWLRYFKYGPLEWVWRCLTNLQYIPNYCKK